MESVSAPTPAKPKPREFSKAISIAREAVAIAKRAPGVLIRKYAPWEKIPLVAEVVKGNIEKVGTNALVSMRQDLFNGAKAGNAADREAFIEIFGIDPGNIDPNKSPNFSNVRYVNKGWNSLVLSFTTSPDGVEKNWIVKVGYKYSPDGEFFLHPQNPDYTKETNANLQCLEDATQENGAFTLPDLLPSLRVVRHLAFNDHKGRSVERSVAVMPYEQILPLDQVQKAVRNDPALAAQLQTELATFTRLRKWLCTDQNIDIDLTGSDNVVVVRGSDSEDGLDFHLKLLDLGLRDHRRLAPIAHGQFDFLGLRNGLALRRAIWGREGEEHYDEDRQTELDVIRTGRHMRNTVAQERGKMWWQQSLARFMKT